MPANAPDKDYAMSGGIRASCSLAPPSNALVPTAILKNSALQNKMIGQSAIRSTGIGCSAAVTLFPYSNTPARVRSELALDLRRR